MTKDRLADLQVTQDESDLDDAFDIPLPHPMDAFFNEVQTTREILTQLENDVADVKQLHSTILTAPQKDPQHQQKLDDLEAAIKRNTNKVRSKLREIEREDEYASGAETRMRMTQHMTLSKHMVEIMTEYNTAQVDYSERCKAKLQRQLEIVGKATTAEELDQMLADGDVSVFTGDIVTETKQEKQRLADIEARHADIVKLERSIKELHDMFIDMAALVESHGELFDRIEYHVEETKKMVDDATKDLKAAAKSQTAARKKKIMILMCLSVAAMIGISSVVGWFI